MKNLPVRVRHKAVEIANALLEDGYEEGRAISIAIAQAREWTENHPPRQRKPKENSTNGSGSKSRSQKAARAAKGS
jgi:uncharacterized protein YdaT